MVYFRSNRRLEIEGANWNEGERRLWGERMKGEVVKMRSTLKPRNAGENWRSIGRETRKLKRNEKRPWTVGHGPCRPRPIWHGPCPIYRTRITSWTRAVLAKAKSTRAVFIKQNECPGMNTGRVQPVPDSTRAVFGACRLRFQLFLARLKWDLSSFSPKIGSGQWEATWGSFID